ncbi:MAG: YcfL family protein [Puniceicoccaceae bacterium]
MKQSFVALLLVAFTLSGCKTVNRSERAEPRARPAVVNDIRIEKDPSLADRLAIVQVAEDNSGEFLRIQVSLESTSSRTRSYVYQFQWIEANGFEVTSPPAVWKQLRLAGGDRTAVAGVAPNPRVVDFRFKVLERSRWKLLEK